MAEVVEQRGRGRPPTARGQYKREIAAARKLFGDGLLDVSQHAMDLARGCFLFEVRTNRGKWVKPDSLAVVERCLAYAPDAVRVYQQPPDLGAIQLVWERVAGKVPQPHEHEVRQLIVAITEDHAALAEILRRHIPAEYLAPVAAELGRLEERRRGAALLLAD